MLSEEIISITDRSALTYSEHSLLPSCKSTSVNGTEFRGYPRLNLEITGPEASGQLSSHQHHNPDGWQLASLSFPDCCCSGLEGAVVLDCVPQGGGRRRHNKSPGTTTAAGRELQLLPANPESSRTHQGTLQRAGGQVARAQRYPLPAELSLMPSLSHQLSF